MIIMIIYAAVSFLLDGLMSNYFSTFIVNPSYFRTIYSVIALVVMFNYFDNKTKYLYILGGLGVLFDIVYTNTFILNIVIFLIIYLFLNIMDYYLSNNVFTTNIKAILSIIIYHVVSYLIFLLVHYQNYTRELLWLILVRSIIMTIVYTMVSYFVMKKIYSKKYDKRVK